MSLPLLLMLFIQRGVYILWRSIYLVVKRVVEVLSSTGSGMSPFSMVMARVLSVDSSLAPTYDFFLPVSPYDLLTFPALFWTLTPHSKDRSADYPKIMIIEKLKSPRLPSSGTGIRQKWWYTSQKTPKIGLFDLLPSSIVAVVYRIEIPFFKVN